jgi:protein-tyrosine phosphatase
MRTNRSVSMTGALNFRDVGGLRTSSNSLLKKGVLFRSDALSRLTQDDLSKLSALSIKTIIDLRHSEEEGKAHDRIPTGASVKSVNCGFYAKGTMRLFKAVNSGKMNARQSRELMKEVYAHMPIKHVEEIRQVVHHLLLPQSTPCLIHCMSGKDRTGLVIAIVLKAIDVQFDDIIDDYEMSNGEYQTVDVFDGSAQKESIAAIMAADASYLIASFTAIEKVYGSFGSYLSKGLMLSDKDLNKLKNLLVA